MTRSDDEGRDDREVGAQPTSEPVSSPIEHSGAASQASAAPEAEHDPDAEFMREFEAGFEAANDDPDVQFTLATEEPGGDVTERAQQVGHQIARELAALGPQRWARLEAVFVLASTAELAQVLFSEDDQRTVGVQPTEAVLALAREHRQLSAQLSDGPWWRLLLRLTRDGRIEIDYDYGDEPFPDDQLFPVEIYRADLQAFPRERLPVWLAAYINHDNRQSRSAQVAAAQAREDRETDVHGVVSERDFPAFPTLWARWAVMAAAFVAIGSQWGPRVLPALGWFEGARRSGSTLYVLPGGRAVLSGGVWDAPELDATYNGGESMPEYYRGAPEWVANPVLNPRAANGLMSFCYWWDGSSWYRGQSPSADRLSGAVPGVWTAETVADVVAGLLGEQPTDAKRAAVAQLVSAAENGLVTRDLVAAVFDDEGYDTDSAFYQLIMSGIATTMPEPISETDVITRVRRYVEDREMDTTDYPLDQLRADRLSVGWMVYVPTAVGELSIGRAIFYVADDGVLEHSSSSVAPSVYLAEFEDRFYRRHGVIGA